MIGAVASVVFNRLPNAADKLSSEIERILDTAADTGVQAADPVTRIRTGDLRKNKVIEEAKGERTIRWLQDYAVYQDKGTVHHSGTDFTGAASKAGLNVIVREFSSLNLG